MNEEELMDLEESQFREKLEQLEQAMYGLEEDTFHRLLQELNSCRYCQVALHTLLGPVQKKADSASYFSAVELLAEIKEKLEKAKEG